MSCSFFLSLCICFIFGVYFLITIISIPKNDNISNPIIHELINTYISIIIEAIIDENILSSLPKAKLNVSASFVILLIISPEDFSSKATAGRLSALLYALKPNLLVNILSTLYNIELPI